jgi:hypothetical protein
VCSSDLERRVEDAVFAILVEEAGGGAENSAGGADVFAEQEDALVAPHFLVERFDYCFYE